VLHRFTRKENTAKSFRGATFFDSHCIYIRKRCLLFWLTFDFIFYIFGVSKLETLLIWMHTVLTTTRLWYTIQYTHLAVFFLSSGKAGHNFKNIVTNSLHIGNCWLSFVGLKVIAGRVPMATWLSRRRQLHPYLPLPGLMSFPQLQLYLEPQKMALYCVLITVSPVQHEVCHGLTAYVHRVCGTLC